MGYSGPREDWRNERGYRRLLDIDRAGIMWEWLRRDPRYVSWYARTSATDAPSSELHPDNDPIQWGLHFRRASGCRGTGGPADLACRTRSWRPPCRSGADRP
ncbi:transcriptional regulator domain-containing protein [Sphingomonas sp. DT-204]|uniref:transcriptional regulator domain-containing protein n=1 Tax=Sphingomonas sp. DT-204 TaxID=3396166 RepID=UPI003F1E1AC6